jgi:hypothetical protein
MRSAHEMSESVICIICGSPMSFFLSKPFGVCNLDSADYWRCSECGFVISKTHIEMSDAAWERLNYESHASYQGKESDPGDPRWITRLQGQIRMLNDAQLIGLLDRRGRWLDYACGDAKLSRLLYARHGLTVLNYERYMPHQAGFIDESDLVAGSFDLVITTSVFEHIRERRQFDMVEALVGPQGVLGIHTLVCESVPADPTWFYMNPVHCTFHTNRSMEILFRQWGYSCSVYNVEAQLWLWFKTNWRHIEEMVRRANVRSGGPIYVFKHGFVDYWKCVPAR